MVEFLKVGNRDTVGFKSLNKHHLVGHVGYLFLQSLHVRLDRMSSLINYINYNTSITKNIKFAARYKLFVV